MKPIIKKLLFRKENTFLENVFMCLGITLASAFCYYDHYNSFAEIFRVMYAFLIFVVWIIGGFSSGKSQKKGFLIFIVLYWTIPNAYMLYYSLRNNVQGYSKWLSMINKFADLIANKPFGYVSEAMNISEQVCVVSLVLMSGSAYFIAKNLKDILCSDD